MGPLVPEIFSSEANYLIALIIGFFFGFILEQAGFSSSKKLTGLFYGRDFVVLRVFFTAGVTAMLGILLLGNMGYLDLGAIFINPTFLYSALIGGAIMGLGFIIGGFCPGTSIVAATTGKIDAMLFVAGAFIGVFIFGEIYPSIKSIYFAFDAGNITLYEVMDISPGLLAFLITLIAYFTFILVRKIEKKVNKCPSPEKLCSDPNRETLYVAFGGIFVVFALFLIFCLTCLYLVRIIFLLKYPIKTTRYMRKFSQLSLLG